MKIAVLHSSDLNKISPGGVTQYVKQLIKYCDSGEITVFGTCDCNTGKTGIREKREYAGKEYYFLPISTNRRRPLSIYYALNEFRYMKQLVEYDIIFSQRMEYSLPFLFNKRGRKKLVQIVHGSIKYSIEYYGKLIGLLCSFSERISIKIARKTFVILQRKEVGVPYYKQEYKKNKDRILYGKVPIDTNLFCAMDKADSREKLGIDLNSKVALYLGRLDDDPKRILLYPEIVSKVLKTEKDFMFLIIGTGEDREKLESKIKEYSLEEKVKVVGYVEAGVKLSTYIAASDCTINISKFEGTCTSTLESIACKRPVITTDVGDVEKYMANGENGLIIPNDDNIVENAVKALTEVLNNGSRMNQVFKEYEGDFVIGELKEVFEEVIKNECNN